ncbi:hypothetical protein DLC15_05110 [Salmonella enterica subsp. enterica serovar Telelkebir]|nr:hypothetical protein [Salmonella enterica subsp. enterica serovar Telelkebir]
MIGDVLIVILIFGCSAWVFYDASIHRIGAYKTTMGNWTGCSPLMWAVATFFVIPFAVYLLRRQALIKYASEHPVKTDGSKYGVILFIIMILVLLFLIKV